MRSPKGGVRKYTLSKRHEHSLSVEEGGVFKGTSFRGPVAATANRADESLRQAAKAAA